MKPDPKHIGCLFRHRGTGLLAHLIVTEPPTLVAKDTGEILRPSADDFETHWEPAGGPGATPAAHPSFAEPIRAAISRLRAAGFEQAEFSLFDSAPTGLLWRFRGIFRGDWIAVDLSTDEGDAVERIEAMVMEKVREREEAAK